MSDRLAHDRGPRARRRRWIATLIGLTATTWAPLRSLGQERPSSPPRADRLPPGRGWYCVPEGARLRETGLPPLGPGAPDPHPAWCTRTESECNSNDLTVRCMRQRSAWCFTFDGAAHSGTLTHHATCARTERDCARYLQDASANTSSNVSLFDFSSCASEP